MPSDFRSQALKWRHSLYTHAKTSPSTPSVLLLAASASYIWHTAAETCWGCLISLKA
ncbi:hypothetical protein XELAEV_18038993mg [Xenopus laevis]|uniref:Uncharacterized protein n=1 Tax=Xenopus laevis TaxID=8355 RepID=A0A974C734_XENLA|nr:hypothetical protein XELAEV_18038993mg [Xenopus laevis]